jgi:hypothetical protein
MISIPVIEVSQPVGQFYIGVSIPRLGTGDIARYVLQVAGRFARKLLLSAP